MMRAQRPTWRLRLAWMFLIMLGGVALLAPRLANQESGWLVRHEPGLANAFARLLPPGPATLHVLPLAGSSMADRLGLLDLKSLGEGAYVAERFSPQDLWRPVHEESVAQDFALVTASYERYIIRIDVVNDVADVLAQITDATNGAVEAKIELGAPGFVLRDHSRPAEPHWLGTDRHGADVAAGLIHATRTVLLVAIVATLIAFVLGVMIGSIMGAFGGWADVLGLRLIELFSAAPRLLLLLVVAAAVSARGAAHMPIVMMSVIGLTTWMTPARLVRGEMIRLREQEFVMAARAVGTPAWRVVVRHLLPGALAPVLVEGAFYMSAAVLLETNLSFLGLGVRPPGTSWGAMLGDAIDPATGLLNWWLLAFPGGMVFLTILSIHTIGEAWRRRLNIKSSWV